MGSLVLAVIANLYMETFQEQAITTSPYKPRVRKRCVDHTFTVLDFESFDSFLQHLNNQQPSIRFTMETESDCKPAFLDATVSKEPDGRLTTSIYRKPTHTDQYLVYVSHQLQSEKCGIVKGLYDRTKHNITKPSVTSKEKKQPVTCFVSSGHPLSFLQKSPRPENRTPAKEPRPSSNPLQFYLTSTVCLNSFAAAYSNIRYMLFVSQKQH